MMSGSEAVRYHISAPHPIVSRQQVRSFFNQLFSNYLEKLALSAAEIITCRSTPFPYAKQTQVTSTILSNKIPGARCLSLIVIVRF